MKLEQFIREQAFALGFGAVGIAAAGPSKSFPAFNEWLSRGCCGGMDYLKKRAALRADPRNLAPQAKSIIVAAAPYPAEQNDCPISNYARGADYHDVVRAKLKQLSAALDAKTGRACGGRVCVDSAPLAEREWAVRAGIGWIGRQGSVVNPEIGCCFFLGELMVNIALEPDRELRPQCGACRLCVDACPAGAIMPGNCVDARRCISYLTVEHKGGLDPARQPFAGNSIFGCDCCTAVCPWNRRRPAPVMPEFDVPPSVVPPLAELAALNQEEFAKKFSGTPVERIGLERFLRNVNLALKGHNNPEEQNYEH
ncbi:MAG: tRNA epoxyqueuosine(34) reductase QueG [Kiritimatiellae bacterium]|nr:tRNA epoxyqueuosine(34) reductase QueG [Kiritimatiellia bacterium]